MNQRDSVCDLFITPAEVSAFHIKTPTKLFSHKHFQQLQCANLPVTQEPWTMKKALRKVNTSENIV